MKINFILPSIGVSGGVNVVVEYANRLHDKGHDVSIVYPTILPSQLLLRFNPDNYFIKRLFYDIIKFFRLGSKIKPSEQLNWLNLKVKLIEVPTLEEVYIPEADIVIATWWETAIYVSKYNSNKGKKFHLIQHHEVWGGPKNLVESTYKLDLIKIVIAKWLYSKLSNLGIPLSELEYIPNGINFHKFKLMKSIEDRPKRVAMIFSHNTFKRSSDGIKALKIAKAACDDLEAILFGIHSRPDYLPKWVEYVQNPPQDKLVEEIYNGSSIYLCSSLTEGWHLPPAEAMACGCAVVSTDIGGVEDYAIHKKTALLSPVKNPDFLADNLLVLLKNDNLRINLAYAGNSHIKNFTWEKATNKLESILKID